MRPFIIPLLFCLLTQIAFGAEWFSDKPREFKALLADPREAQVRVGFLASGNRNSYAELGLGGHLGLYREDQEAGALSIDVRGLINARFQFGSPHFDFQNGDMLGGSALSYRKNLDAFEFFPYHQSSHLGADALVHQSVPLRVYSFEALRVLHSHQFPGQLRTYEGIEVKVRSNPSDSTGKITLIAGGDWYFIKALPQLYTAIDIRFKQEHQWAPNTALSLGYELGNSINLSRKQRVFVEVFNGYSNAGQFSEEREFYFFGGVGFTL